MRVKFGQQQEIVLHDSDCFTVLRGYPKSSKLRCSVVNSRLVRLRPRLASHTIAFSVIPGNPMGSISPRWSHIWSLGIKRRLVLIQH
jgi:hypothetical protein